jgi:ABC-type polysaccharide/polyol phosphate export permease
VRANASLVTDIYFPRALLPITETTIGLAHFGVGLCVIPIFMLFLKVAPTPNLVYLPLIIAVQVIFNLGAAYPMAVWGLRYRNLPNLMGNILRLWFYLSPALYELARFKNGKVLFIMELNPLTGLFESYRRVFALAGSTATQACPKCPLLPHYYAGAPHPALIWTFALGSMMLLIGAWYFTRKEAQFGKEI